MTARPRPSPGNMPSLLCPPPPPLPGVAAVPQAAPAAVDAPDSGMLGRLAGVNCSDDRTRERELGEAANGRTRPRLTLTPMHALVIMLLLVGALAASLTLLARQAMNAARVDGAVVAVVATEASEGDGGTGTQGGGSGEAQSSGESGSPGATETSANGALPDGTANEPVPKDGVAGTEAGAAAGESQQSEPIPSSGVTASASPSPDDGRVNLNTAGVAQLDAVKGIGPAIAQRIVDHRNRNGPFSSVDDLLDVPGIGPKTLTKMRDQLVVR